METKVQRIIWQVVSNCGECPFMRWTPNTHEGNEAGTAECWNARRTVSNDTPNPDIPEWCPFPVCGGAQTRCPSCGSFGFAPSVLPGRCEFCDGTVGGVGPGTLEFERG